MNYLYLISLLVISYGSTLVTSAGILESFLLREIPESSNASISQDSSADISLEDTSRVEYNGYRLFNVTMRSKKESKYVYMLSKWDGVHFWSIHRWTSKIGEGYAHVLAAPYVIDNVTSLLDSMNISYRIMIEDLQVS